MTKKELSNLHSVKCTIERVQANIGRGPEPRVVVSMSLTPSEFATLNQGLEDLANSNGSGSVFGHIISDLIAFIRNAKERVGWV